MPERESLTRRRDVDPTVCSCAPDWRCPKPNGTCATCGGWLPGEKPKPFFADLPRDEEHGEWPHGFGAPHD